MRPQTTQVRNVLSDFTGKRPRHSHGRFFTSFKELFLFITLITSFLPGWAQTSRTGTIQGIIRDKNTQELLIGVSLLLEGTTLGTTSDTEGRYSLTAPVGSYNLKATLVGYGAATKFNVNLTSGNAQEINFELEEESKALSEVVVKANRAVASVASVETPNSIQRLSTEEIRANPGGNFDISRVIQALPGVGGTSGSVGGFRNDIIIRGGAPNENVYYLDGIEIPVINHFATQGSAGGPTGILNVSFIEDVTLKSSSWEARYDNALASVFQFKQREGNPERLSGNVRLSGTELAGTLEGPLGPKTTFLASARRSYLQLLFSLIDLPIRPSYWDFQYKTTTKLNAKTTLTTLGVGAIDDFSFAVPKESTPDREYILRANPIIQQWNYTVGASIKRLIDNGFVNVALSRNMFNNSLTRYEDNTKPDSTPKNLDVSSQEIENKLRVDVNKSVDGWKFSYGGVLQYVKYNTSFFNQFRPEIRNEQGQVIQLPVEVRFASDVDFFRYGLFGQVAKTFGRLGLSGGLRTDMNSFTNDGNNPLRTLSPRLAASYALSDQWNVNASWGQYYKLPIYTVLGFRNEAGQFVNQDNRYIGSTHWVAGLEFIPKPSVRFTVEGFYKNYSNYPVSVRDGISLANQGGDFGSIGNERTQSIGEGRAYGMEVFFQQKLTKNIFATASYTLVWSQFSGVNGRLVPSAWDSRHLFSGILGRKFKKGWEMGLRYRYASGAPYTPFDLEASQRNYASVGTGVLNFGNLNTLRLRAFNQFDFRIDKKWNYKRTTLDVFFDVTNAFLARNPSLPQYTFQRTADGPDWLTSDGLPLASDGSNAQPVILRNEDASVIPTIGFIVEF
ncbi:TonB-dependent receptor [Arundinibacter roseus]|uniref:TonB-dependent receptor n=1 Tax=Arundinibacter roseus TaxID=2070510 RepID=A0A4R4KCL1_9BACT|nr:TonB-dependent receptor [Arundinibacter roseus]TDB63999.1 TonB-dependent receptor [Arundinibacter roseus]